MILPRGNACLVDATMLYAPESGGVKRYLNAKRDWLAASRPGVRHALVVPGARDGYDGSGAWSIYTTPLPFGKGYRWPLRKTPWVQRIERERPTIIEAGDPYTPGLAALRAGGKLGVPVVGFCHSDIWALATLHLGQWAGATVRKRWGRIYRRFDAVLAPSRYLAERLEEAGAPGCEVVPLGVDLVTFSPALAEQGALRERLGVAPHEKLLVFAGRAAAEKRIDVMVEAVERLGDGYRLLLIGCGRAVPASRSVVTLPFERDKRRLARILASCDAFLHANPNEALGLVVLEAMACGLPVVGVDGGGVGESVTADTGQLAAEPTAPALAEAIEALFARDLGVISKAARARVETFYGWDQAFSRISAIYARLTQDAAFLGPDEVLYPDVAPPSAEMVAE